MKNNGNGSYLPGFDTAIAARRRAAEALVNEWATSGLIREIHADADDPPDPLEDPGYEPSRADLLPAEGDGAGLPDESVRPFLELVFRVGRSTPILSPRDAQCYAHLTLPKYHCGRCANVLRTVF